MKNKILKTAICLIILVAICSAVSVALASCTINLPDNSTNKATDKATDKTTDNNTDNNTGKNTDRPIDKYIKEFDASDEDDFSEFAIKAEGDNKVIYEYKLDASMSSLYTKSFLDTYLYPSYEMTADIYIATLKLYGIKDPIVVFRFCKSNGALITEYSFPKK